MPAIVRTELTDGVKDHWLIKSSSAEQVADAIVAALKKPRFDVFVPRSLGALNRVDAAVAAPAQGWMLRALKADTLMSSAAHSPAREAYERRAAGPADAAEAIWSALRALGKWRSPTRGGAAR